MPFPSDKPDCPTRVQVAIVGGGIGGLAAGLFLRARGFDVHVFEAKSADEVEAVTRRGNGIHLYAHCARMLHAIGLPIEEYCTPMDIQMRRDDGHLRADITRPVQQRVHPPLSAMRASVYSLLRQQLYWMLVEHTEAGRLHCDMRCTGFEDRGDVVELTFADDTRVTADFVVGADGIHSFLAEQLFGPRALNKHDIVIVQGLSSYVGLEGVETWLLRRGGGTMGLVPVVLPSKEPGTFWWITLSASELDDPNRSDMDVYRLYCERYSWEYVTQVAEKTDPTSLERWHSQDRVPLKTWCRGRIALLGDACHAANPFSGYGAGMSIEDGYWLARLLGDPSVLDRPDDFQQALKQYEEKRVGLTTGVVRDATQLMRMLHPRSPLVGKALDGMWLTGLPGKLVERKFVSVFAKGLADTEWTDAERESGKLAV